MSMSKGYKVIISKKKCIIGGLILFTSVDEQLAVSTQTSVSWTLKRDYLYSIL